MNKKKTLSIVLVSFFVITLGFLLFPSLSHREYFADSSLEISKMKPYEKDAPVFYDASLWAL